MKACLILLLLTGCSINKLIPSPYAGAIIQHSRFFGVSAAYQGYGVKLGWGSEVFCVLPVSTNKIYAAPISDTLSIGQTINPFDTVIREYLQTGWEGSTMPQPAMRIFDPHSKTNSP